MTSHISDMPRASTKEQIVTAAVETLHMKGFNATSVEDITNAAKVPKGSFYNHFKSKEDLAIEALDRYWQNMQTSLGLLSDEKRPPVARLKRHFRHLGKVAREDGYRAGCMIGNMSTEMPDQSQPVREKLALLLAAWSCAIESCIKEAQADGSIRRDMDTRTISGFLLNSWEGAVMRSKVDRGAESITTFADVVFSVLTL
jgi:TetR/AcrR family transcriptional regulator, transcriptional repressor for nem operon